MVTVSQKQKLCHHLPHVDSNLYDFLCVEHKRKYLEEFGKPNSFGEHCFLSIQLKINRNPKLLRYQHSSK